MNKEKVTRRNFLRTTGTGATLAAVAGSAPAVLAAKSPNDTIGVGHIGLGVRGGTLVSEVAGRQLGGGIPGTKVVAVSDVYKPHMEKGAQRSMNPEVKQYVDYQDLLADPNVDVVVIATPDHWHAQMLIDASNAGKDIYIEKGWTRTIEEAKKMRETIKKNKTIMQLGHQSRGQKAGVQAKELIAQGLLGPVHFVRTGRYTNNPMGRNIYRWYGWYDHYERPDQGFVVENLDWKRWLGPVGKQPFSMEHFWHWRCYWDYGTGVAGDLLSHEIDFVHAMLGHGIPDSCTCTGLNAMLDDGREVPDTWITCYRFEDAQRTVTFESTMNSSTQGQVPEFRGKEALLRFDSIAQSVNTFWVYPEATSQKYKDKLESEEISTGKPMLTYDPSTTPDIPSHMQDFFNCVRSRQRPKCHEDEAFIETATLVMSVAAYMSKREVRWDKEKEEIVIPG